LRRSVARLGGAAAAGPDRCELSLDFVDHSTAVTGVEEVRSGDGETGRLTATLPSDWIPETRLRIEAFRRLALARDAAEVAETRRSLRDRYGRIPPEAEALLGMAELRCLAERKHVASLATEGEVIRCVRVLPGSAPETVRLGTRFPRLTVREPLRKLKEMRGFLSRLPDPQAR
ncbi:MAG: TRCF domain-containing protein, partial [Verrucomicrobiota bacterium]